MKHIIRWWSIIVVMSWRSFEIYGQSLEPLDAIAVSWTFICHQRMDLVVKVPNVVDWSHQYWQKNWKSETSTTPRTPARKWKSCCTISWKRNHAAATTTASAYEMELIANQMLALVGMTHMSMQKLVLHSHQLRKSRIVAATLMECIQWTFRKLTRIEPMFWSVFPVQRSRFNYRGKYSFHAYYYFYIQYILLHANFGIEISDQLILYRTRYSYISVGCSFLLPDVVRTRTYTLNHHKNITRQTSKRQNAQANSFSGRLIAGVEE